MLTRAIEAVLRADDYGYKTEEFLMLVISAAIRTTITDNAETISPEAKIGAGLNGNLLGNQKPLWGGKIAVQSQNNGQDKIALISRGILPDNPPDKDAH